MQIPFVKGHCGWDVMTLTLCDHPPSDRELDIARTIFRMPINGGLEVGFLGRGESENEINLRVAASTQQDWVPMCGGMTQVIGKALVETSFRHHFDVDLTGGTITRTLVTDSGRVPLSIFCNDGVVEKTVAGMNDYVDFLYKDGVEPIEIDGVETLRVGNFLVINVESLERRYPGPDFTRRDHGPHLDLVNSILEQYERQRRLSGVFAMLYDHRPDGPGQLRLFPRFFGGDGVAARIPWEFQCGTGGIAVCAALAHRKEIPFTEDHGDILFEWGNQRVTPDPYGIRTSEVSLRLEDGEVREAAFSHSVVEINAEGRLTLPAYDKSAEDGAG